MRKITFLWCLLICLTTTLSAQELRPSSTMDDLLKKYSQVGNQTGSISDFFTASEQQKLKEHFSKRKVIPNSSPVIYAPTGGDSFLGSRRTGTPIFNLPAGSATLGDGLQEAAAVVITHSVTQTINPGDGITCNTGGIANNNSFFRDFDLSTFGISGDFEVTSAEFGIETISSNFPVTVNIYSIVGAWPGGALTLEGTTVYNAVPGDAGTVVSVPISATIPAGLHMIYELAIVGNGSTSFFLGCNLDGQTGPSWITAPDCGANTPTDLFAAFGLNNSFVMNIVGDEAGGGGGGTGLAYGALTFPAPEMFINFDPTTPDVLNNVGPAGTVGPNFEGSGAIDPNNPNTAIVVNNVGGIFSVDITTGVYTSLGNVGLPGGLNGLEFNPVDGVLYGVDGTTLYTVDPGVPSATAVGPLGSAGLAIALAINGAGEAYTYDIVDDNSYSINLATGAATLLGPTGFDGNFGQGMTWDPNTDTIYLAAFNNGAFLGEWRSFNTGTGATTLLGVLGGTTPGGTNQVAWASISGAGPVADNDDCANATEVSCGNTYLGDTSDNTDQGGFDTSPDEWFEFTGSGSFEYVTLSLCDGGTGFDSRLTVFDACGGAQVATNDDFCGLQSELTFTSNGTSTYYIAVEGFGGATGAFSMAVSCVPAPPPPSNDLCANAIAVSCGDFISGTTIDATIDSAVAPLCDTGVTSPGVWYVLTDNTGLVTDITITMCTGTTDYDAKLSVYTGDCGAPPLTCVVGNDDTCGLQSEVSFQSDGNTTFLILVHGFGGATGNFELDIQCTPIPPPNDEIANSIDVDEIGCPYTDPAVAMPAATSEAGGTPAGCDNAGARGVWYNFTPTTDGTASASIQNQPTPQVNLIVNNGPLAGYYAAVPASFGGTLTTFPLTQDTAVVIDDNSGGGTDENDACDPVTNGGALAGKIAIVRRGSCEFGAKALAAEMAGAIAVIVVNNNPDPPIVMGGGAVGDQVTIPAVMVADVFGEALIAEVLGGGTVNATLVMLFQQFSSITFYTAPDENAVETDLVLVDYWDNQCAPGTSASIPTVAGQTYYVYAVNHGGIADIFIECDVLDVEDNVIAGFSFYPNPADDVLNLTAVNIIESATIYNMLGQKVVDQNIEATTSQLNISNLATGSYVMKVTVNGHVGTYKLLKK
ncbi:PA domain-containing protein [Ulvibacter sp. MAR_2010_11]|uniref:PA domain-containing protein n=1 Tax=Ulvibacter sp. MAR_2010_11 TaxID=1250229 RepID=UPI0012FD7157|nr:PA domain-containing protein [Ulvibacter sp. MAR_2010_11]